MTRAVVLARGLGTRMRANDPDAQLSADQARAADAGFKAMMPVHGRPFLDYVPTTIADAGVEHVGLIVAPDHASIRAYYAQHPPQRVRLHYIVQPDAIGTANAMLHAEPWCGTDPFLVMNSDNLYPPAALRALVELEEPGVAVFSRDGLVRESNIPPQRIRSFALVDVDADGYLARIVEKPPQDSGGHLVSMNCWRFDARIFEACRDVPRSARGEFELPEAVGVAIARSARIRCIRAAGAVLDLSTRADAADVERRLTGLRPVP
jgi:glucose-1-phosphate thymidylyltransferase